MSNFSNPYKQHRANSPDEEDVTVLEKVEGEEEEFADPELDTLLATTDETNDAGNGKRKASSTVTPSPQRARMDPVGQAVEAVVPKNLFQAVTSQKTVWNLTLTSTSQDLNPELKSKLLTFQKKFSAAVDHTVFQPYGYRGELLDTTVSTELDIFGEFKPDEEYFHKEVQVNIPQFLVERIGQGLINAKVVEVNHFGHWKGNNEDGLNPAPCNFICIPIMTLQGGYSKYNGLGQEEYKENKYYNKDFWLSHMKYRENK